MRGTATISDDGLYRYDLTRRWNEGMNQRMCMWVMLNPSTADAAKDDQTIRQCIFFSKREGFGGLVVCNLYAYRTAYPTELVRAATLARGPLNTAIIEEWLERPEVTACVCAWGATKLGGLPPRPDIERMAQLAAVPCLCLGVTKSGVPRHPSRLGHDVALEPWGRSQ